MKLRLFFLFSLVLALLLPVTSRADDKLIALQADDGHWMARCAGCQPVAPNVFNNSMMLHIGTVGTPPEQPFARLTLQDAGNGQVALRADDGSYLARCNRCVPAGATPDFLFSHITKAADPKSLPIFAKFKLTQLPNGKYTLQADTGKLVARCNSCSPGASAPNQVTIHGNPGDPWAQWRLVDLTPNPDWVRLENRYLTGTFITVNPPTIGGPEGAQAATVSAIKPAYNTAPGDNSVFERITMGPWVEYDPRATGVTYAFRSKAYPNIYLYTPPRDPDVPNAPETDPQDLSTYVGRDAMKPLAGQFLSSRKPTTSNRFSLIQALDGTKNRQVIPGAWAFQSLGRPQTKVGDGIFVVGIPAAGSQEVLVTRRPFDIGEGGIPRIQIQADAHWFIRPVTVAPTTPPPGFVKASP